MEAYFALMIPILGILLGFFGVWTHHRQRLVKLEIEARKHAAAPAAATGQQGQQIRELQERVQVLERIVTDGGYDLATRIEALRDARQEAGAELTRDRQPAGQV
jgi:hypothetical protein